MPVEKPIRAETALQNSATAIAKGQVVIQNAVADYQQVVISTANADKILGVALEDSPGQTVAGAAKKPFPVVQLGPCKAKAGGAVTQGLYVESDASGNVVNATAGAGRNVVGKALESGVSGDMVSIWVFPQKITV